MLCYVCAKTGVEVSAVVTCRCCGAGLCMEHLADTATKLAHGALEVDCGHGTWQPREARQLVAR